jgi:hypothetical protein
LGALSTVYQRLRETLFPCPYCSRENIYDHEILLKQGELTCWGARCKQQLQLPPRLNIKIGKRERHIVLNSETRIYAYQLTSIEHDVSLGDVIVGEMAQSPNDTNKWGLRNLTTDNWQYTTSSGTKDVYPNKALVLSKGLTIDFGKAKAEIMI